MPDPPQIAALLAVGLVAGALAGMLGIGGALVMIPALGLLLGDPYGPGSLHVFKLAAITSTVLLALPAASRHLRQGTVIPGVVRAAAPAAAVGVLLGVCAAAWLFSGAATARLRQLFGVFLELLVIAQIWQAARGASASVLPACPVPLARPGAYAFAIGLPSGVLAGLLGVGGGIWTVPILQMFFGAGLRHAVATSTALLLIVASVTCVAQAVAVERMPDLHAAQALPLVACLAPGAALGAMLGSWLVYRLPVQHIRAVLWLVFAWAGARMIAAP